MTSPLIKFGSLAVLVIQNAAFVLLMRYSQVGEKKNSVAYLASTAVFFGEILKLFLSILFFMIEKSFDMNHIIVTYKHRLFHSPNDFINLSIPAFLYVIQNNLLYFASANLDPAPFQLLYQLKIFTTAVLSVFLLNKTLTSTHWKALFVLFVGVVIVQFSTMTTTTSSTIKEDQNPFHGFIAILIAVTCSGLSGVWFEKVLKSQSDVSVWVRNTQMSLISLILCSSTIYLKDYDTVMKEGLLVGYDNIVWSVIILQAGGGLVVAVVVKYADNILKGFSTSISTILATIGSMILFDFQTSEMFIFGAVLVLISAFWYSVADSSKQLKVVNNEEENISLVVVDNVKKIDQSSSNV